MNHQRNDVQQTSRMLLVHSKKLHGVLNSERLIITDRQIRHELRTIDSLNNHFLKETIKNDKWKFCYVQMSLPFEDIDMDDSMFAEIFEVKKRMLLADVYRLVFEDRLSYRLVQEALFELSDELNFYKRLDFLRDPLTMVISALHEHLKNSPMEIVAFEPLASMTKNQSDFF